MVKQEVLKIIAELRIAQQAQNNFRDHYRDFCSVPRCKKGVVEFLKEMRQDRDDSTPWVFHDVEQKLCLSLVSMKSNANSDELRRMLDNSTYVSYQNKELFAKRKELLAKVGEYVLFIHGRLEESALLDKIERQVYLRRAIARLTTVLNTSLVVSVQQDQWHEVEPNEYTNYLTEDMTALVNRFDYNGAGDLPSYCSIYYDWYGLNKPLTIDSIVTFLDYVDGFLQY